MSVAFLFNPEQPRLPARMPFVQTPLSTATEIFCGCFCLQPNVTLPKGIAPGE